MYTKLYTTAGPKFLERSDKLMLVLLSVLNEHPIPRQSFLNWCNLSLFLDDVDLGKIHGMERYDFFAEDKESTPP